ncbi:unnamed protein product [Miscanthus lutarioriparius]|uniref:DUF4220 domain-containing protein n=1 Tax=Miscanthus lutarioriparius TaxID=422564 RepID=A0A811PXC6_9POAL|nr:unnamed protein product [Miscanthus lutarioriparius]
MDPNGGLSLGPTPEEGDPYMTTGYLLTLIRSDKGTHIDVLATAGAVLLAFQALLGSRRRRCRSKVFLLILEAAYTISYVLVSYTIGLIQAFDSPNPAQSQLLWAVVLLLLLGSADTISAFSRHDVEQSKGMQTKHVLQTLLVLWLLLSQRSLAGGGWIIAPFLLLCWVYSIFKMAQRTKALRMASMTHYGLVRSAKVVADYMHTDVVQSHDAGHDPSDMTRYKYLVLGEDEYSIPPSAPPYLTHVPVADDGDVITIDMIWKHDGKLLSSRDERARALKDTCLSFALFKLLKRRFCSLEIAEAGHPKTRDFVLHGLLADNNAPPSRPQHQCDDNPEDQLRRGAERAFHIIEVELSFLYDFFYTKYPVLFPTKRVVGVIRFFFLLVFLVVLLYFTTDAIWVARHPRFVAPYYAFTIFNDFLFVAMIFAIDVLQQLATSYSNWAVVHFVCDYVRTKKKSRWHCWSWIRQELIKWVANCRYHKVRHWDHKLGQYSLLKSLEYDSFLTNTLSLLTLRLMDPKGIGRKREPDVELPPAVMHAVATALRRSLEEGNGCLTNGTKSIKDGEGELLWACTQPTTTHMVLVWHIATTLCDVKDDFTKDKDISHELLPQLHRHRLIATCLSGYCAYLLAFVPEMLPDHSYTTKQILDAVVREARQNLVNTEDKSKTKQILEATVRKAREYLGMTKDMSKIFDKMTELGGIVGGSRGEETPILILGARLHRCLMAITVPRRWELLAEFWAELLLFLAPSDNTDVHAEHLAEGGEFMTHLWALLMHAGILKRRDFTETAV